MTGIQITKDTPIHCAVVLANRDPAIFDNPDSFDPSRPNLDEILCWNGIDGDIPTSETDPKTPPSRYCPGRFLSIEVMKYVVNRFAPQLLEVEVEDCSLSTIQVPADNDGTDTAPQVADVPITGDLTASTNFKSVSYDPLLRPPPVIPKYNKYWKMLDPYSKCIILPCKSS
jgi:hypothetical protein